MSRTVLGPLLLLGACSAPTDDEAPTRPPLPDVWGPAALPDHDPADDVVEVHMSASKTSTAWIEGEKTRVWGYEDSTPGPLIHARVGDTLRVVFRNDLDQATTIHWHGLRIPDDMDGVPHVHDPVQPGEQFVYEFVLPDAGSFWYHPHLRANVQIERGLYGPLVVHEEEPPAYDRERYFLLDDVLLESDGAIADATMTHMEQMSGRYGNTLLANGTTELLTDTIERGTRERWRIVNTANARFMYVDVTGADWRIVAIDGTLLPEPVDPGREPYLLPVGRRLDLEVVPHGDAEEAKLRVDLPDGYGGWDRYPVFAGTLEGEAETPGFLDWDAPALPEVEEPRQDVELVLNATSNTEGLVWLINGRTFEDHEHIRVDGQTPTRLTIRELSGIAHPFHLHGQFFQVVSRDSLAIEPGLQDTTTVNGMETVELYTTFDNPGEWMAHCHILEHAELGMMATMTVSE